MGEQLSELMRDEASRIAVPVPIVLSTVTSPPDWLMKPKTCESPSPVPKTPDFVVKNGSKINGMSSGGIPLPVSSTVIVI